MHITYLTSVADGTCMEEMDVFDKELCKNVSGSSSCVQTPRLQTVSLLPFAEHNYAANHQNLITSILW